MTYVVGTHKKGLMSTTIYVFFRKKRNRYFSIEKALASMAQSDASPAGDQEVAGSVLARSGNILSRRLIIKNIFYGQSFPSTDSRKTVVSFW